jgi:hypothetical protein
MGGADGALGLRSDSLIMATEYMIWLAMMVFNDNNGHQVGDGMMDMKKLAVGQKIWMQSGDQFKEATVEEITENYVRVFVAPSGPFTKELLSDCQPPAIPYSPENQNGYSIDFRYDGSQCGVWEAGGVFDPRPLGTAEYGPYIIDDMPFEERKAELVEAARRRESLHKQYPDGSVIPANDPLPPIFDGPFWH